MSAGAERSTPLLVATFVSGVLFAVGLGVGGMLHPAKVIGFLDFFGAWDPSLLFVMGGGMIASFGFSRLALGRPHPVFALELHLPAAKKVDKALVGGSALFGVGWGLAGYCPGPGVVSVTTLGGDALLFFGAMALGMLAFRVFEQNREAERSDG